MSSYNNPIYFSRTDVITLTTLSKVETLVLRARMPRATTSSDQLSLIIENENK